MVWLATWLEGGGLEVGALLLLVGLVGWLPVLAGWLGSARQRLVPSPGALKKREVGGGQAEQQPEDSFFNTLDLFCTGLCPVLKHVVW